PGFLRPNSSVSWWLQGALPTSADVVIIGTGLSGTTVAYFLLMGPNPPANVVIMDAREACDGATVWNGEHRHPDCF
ncbi:hypothetical protein FISHEDRAFT_28546, partial [Fistulina hepatica ATCC 64428]